MSPNVQERLAYLEDGHLNSIPTEVIIAELISIIAEQQTQITMLQGRQDDQADRIRAIGIGLAQPQGLHGTRR